MEIKSNLPGLTRLKFKHNLSPLGGMGGGAGNPPEERGAPGIGGDPPIPGNGGGRGTPPIPGIGGGVGMPRPVPTVQIVQIVQIDRKKLELSHITKNNIAFTKESSHYICGYVVSVKL